MLKMSKEKMPSIEEVLNKVMPDLKQVINDRIKSGERFAMRLLWIINYFKNPANERLFITDLENSKFKLKQDIASKFLRDLTRLELLESKNPFKSKKDNLVVENDVWYEPVMNDGHKKIDAWEDMCKKKLMGLL